MTYSEVFALGGGTVSIQEVFLSELEIYEANFEEVRLLSKEEQGMFWPLPAIKSAAFGVYKKANTCFRKQAATLTKFLLRYQKIFFTIQFCRWNSFTFLLMIKELYAQFLHLLSLTANIRMCYCNLECCNTKFWMFNSDRKLKSIGQISW